MLLKKCFLICLMALLLCLPLCSMGGMLQTIAGAAEDSCGIAY